MDMPYIHSIFRQKGWERTENVKKADIILIYTCALLKSDEKEFIKEFRVIRFLKKRNARIIVGGCLPGINESLLRKYFKGDVFTPRELERIENLIPRRQRLELKDVLLPKCALEPRPHPHSIWIKIQSGCLGRCTYCAIRHAIGEPRSRTPEELLKQTRALMKRNPNTRMIFFGGDDIGCYGSDININLVELLAFFEERMPKNFKFQIDRIYPAHLKRMLSGLKTHFKNGKITSIYIPYQSASNRILRKMNRVYSIEEIKEIITQIKTWNKELIIILDTMVGFPGETEDDFKKTADFLKRYGSNFIKTNVWLYENRPNILAASMPNQIPWKEKKRRGQIIENIMLAHRKIKYYITNIRSTLSGKHGKGSE